MSEILNFKRDQCRYFSERKVIEINRSSVGKKLPDRISITGRHFVVLWRLASTDKYGPFIYFFDEHSPINQVIDGASKDMLRKLAVSLV